MIMSLRKYVSSAVMKATGFDGHEPRDSFTIGDDSYKVFLGGFGDNDFIVLTQINSANVEFGRSRFYASRVIVKGDGKREPVIDNSLLLSIADDSARVSVRDLPSKLLELAGIPELEPANP